MAVTVTSGGSVRVVVYDSRIDAMSLPGGDVFLYAQTKARRAAAYAQEFAPVRTGHLRRSIRHDTRPVANGAVGRARATAYYSAWVHEGTDTITNGPMWVPKRKFGTYRVWMNEVSGQRAQPFLARGLTAAMNERYLFGRSLLRGNPFG
jgi:hypothetical protein